MKFIHRLVLIGNLVSALLLLLACITPYAPPTRLPEFFSFLSLGVPFLVLLNLIFLIYWIVVRKRFAWVSIVSLVAGYIFLGSFFEFRVREAPVLKEHLSIMTFNVHNFNNNFKSLSGGDIDRKIRTFISTENPDIVNFQEYDSGQEMFFTAYPHKFVNKTPGKAHQAIFSKMPIVNRGSLRFPASSNNAIFADIQYKGDTVRVYNVHLQSFKVFPSKVLLSPDRIKRVYKKMADAFPKQHQQAAELLGHIEASPHPVLICGDFNNTQFSNVYRSIKEERVDSFDEAGTGYGRTFYFRYFPLRIDFILADESYFEVEAHKNYDIRLSDHFPIMASFSIRKS